MKSYLFLVVIAGLVVTGCASPGYYNTQRGAVIGGGLGAITGQAIGRNTEATLLGAGIGTLLGTLVGNMEDQRAAEYRDAQPIYGGAGEPLDRYTYTAPAPRVQREPPGRWVTVPGRWCGNRWVPEHEEWRPVDPR